MLYEAILLHHSIPQTSARRTLWVVFLQHIATGVLLCCSGHLACLVRQRHWRAQVVAVVVVDGNAGMLLSFLFLQLSLHATDHGLHEGQGQHVTRVTPVGLACGNDSYQQRVRWPWYSCVKLPGLCRPWVRRAACVRRGRGSCHPCRSNGYV